MRVHPRFVFRLCSWVFPENSGFWKFLLMRQLSTFFAQKNKQKLLMCSTNSKFHFIHFLFIICAAFAVCSVITILLFNVKLDSNYKHRAQIEAYKQRQEKLEEMLAKKKHEVEVLHRKAMEKKLFTPIGDLRTRPEREELSTVLCFIFSTILSTGGVEMWFWSLYYETFSKSPYTVYAIMLNDIWNHDVVKRFSEEGLKFNPGGAEMMDKCDIIIQTGAPPLPTYKLSRKPARVLVIHGGMYTI